jgi:hypothetical protein
MAIKDRNLETGSILEGTYRQQGYECRVEVRDEKRFYILEDAREFKSPSAAASALMGGKAVNGWLFWTKVDETIGPTSPASPKGKLIRKLPNQQGMQAGKTRYWCCGCMKSFIGDTAELPEACPAGHTTKSCASPNEDSGA